MTRIQTRFLSIVVGLVILSAFLSIGFHTEHAIDRLKWLTNQAPPTAGARSIATVRAGRTVIWERAVHDEVTGSLAYSLGLVGVEPILNVNLRHGFGDVLKEALPYEPEILSPHPKPPVLGKWLEEDNIDNLVLTTCSDGLKHFEAEINKASAHVFCVVHHAGGAFKRDLYKLLLPLAEQKRVTLVTLGYHVQSNVVSDLREWADTYNVDAFADIPVETLVPLFEYPPNRTFTQPDIFPTKVTIQGNIEHGRRNYVKIFADLTAAIEADPKLWGYREAIQDGNKTYVPLGADSSPFELHLLGQRAHHNPVQIPAALSNVIQIHENQPYTEFYKLCAESDLLVPAFQQRGTFIETASSTMGTAMIVQTPVLVSQRHQASYTYIQGAAAIQRGVAEGEVAALGRLRKQSFEVRAAAAAAASASKRKGAKHTSDDDDDDDDDEVWTGYDGSGKTRPPPAVQAAEWRVLVDGVHLANAEMWARHLRPPRIPSSEVAHPNL